MQSAANRSIFILVLATHLSKNSVRRSASIALLGFFCMLTGVAPLYAQSNCAAAKKLCDDAHRAQAIATTLAADHPQRSKVYFDKAIAIFERLKSFPRECRLEDDSTLTMYQNNIRTLIARHQANPPPKLPPSFGIEAQRPVLERAGCTVP